MTDETGRRGRTDDRANTRLPVTSEVGSEGGSYADPTIQEATFGDHDAIRRVDDRGGLSSAATYSTDFGSVAAGGVGAGPGPDAGMLRYPTEPPSRKTGAGEPRIARQYWRGALRGAAAGALGAAIALGLRRLRRRS